MKRRAILIATALLTVAAILVVGAQQGDLGAKLGNRATPFNERISSAVPVVGPGAGATSFPLEITDQVYELTIRIQNSPADLDILIYDEYGDLVTYSELFDFNEVLTLSRVGNMSLETGSYTVDIAYQLSRPPVVSGSQLSEIPFDVTFEAVIPQVLRTMRPGQSTTGRLEPARGMVDLYQIEVPTGVGTLRVDISDTDADLDLAITRDRLLVSPFEADILAQSVRSTETLIVDRNGAQPLRPGTYYLLVFDQLDNTYPSDYTLTIHDGPDAPPLLAQPIEVPTAPPVLAPVGELPVLATVEILTEASGGSGVIIDPRGYILTNYHVVVDETGRIASEVTIGFSVDYDRPPAEIFTARVIETAEDRDLALLEISAGRYGQPLPTDAQFPWVPLRLDEPLLLGEELHFLGYPSVGGTGSRASLTYTRGIVAGFQRVPFGRLIKTDGEINQGNSGGAALDSSMRLVGLPTETVGLDAGQIAYVYPVTAIPEAWLRMIGR